MQKPKGLWGRISRVERRKLLGKASGVYERSLHLVLKTRNVCGIVIHSNTSTVHPVAKHSDSSASNVGVSGYPHKFRHTFTARLLSKRVPTEHVSKILGQSSPRTLLIHYSAWIKLKQELLDEDVRRSWDNPPEKPDDGPTKSATNENRQNQPSAKIARTRINIG